MGCRGSLVRIQSPRPAQPPAPPIVTPAPLNRHSREGGNPSPPPPRALNRHSRGGGRHPHGKPIPSPPPSPPPPRALNRHSRGGGNPSPPSPSTSENREPAPTRYGVRVPPPIVLPAPPIVIPAPPNRHSREGMPPRRRGREPIPSPSTAENREPAPYSIRGEGASPQSPFPPPPNRHSRALNRHSREDGNPSPRSPPQSSFPRRREPIPLPRRHGIESLPGSRYRVGVTPSAQDLSP